MDYTKVDWVQPRPDPEQLLRDWTEVQITPLSVDDPRLVAVMDELRRSHCNGGALLGRFAIDAPDSWRWLLSRNRLGEGFIELFLRAPLFGETLGCAPGELHPTDVTSFRMETPFVSVGRLASVLSSGGAYLAFEGGDSVLLEMVRAFVAAAFEDRYSDIRAFESHEPWCGWFHDVAWDLSFLWFDAKAGVLTVLLITDTD